MLLHRCNAISPSRHLFLFALCLFLRTFKSYLDEWSCIHFQLKQQSARFFTGKKRKQHKLRSWNEKANKIRRQKTVLWSQWKRAKTIKHHSVARAHFYIFLLIKKNISRLLSSFRWWVRIWIFFFILGRSQF